MENAKNQLKIKATTIIWFHPSMSKSLAKVSQAKYKYLDPTQKQSKLLSSETRNVISIPLYVFQFPFFFSSFFEQVSKNIILKLNQYQSIHILWPTLNIKCENPSN